MPPIDPLPNSARSAGLRHALFSAALTIGLFFVWTAPVAASEKALAIKQSSLSVGVSVSYLTSQALRVDIGSDKTYLVAKAPSWKVVLFNSVNNCGLEMSYNQWISHHPKWNHGKDTDWLPFEKMLKVASPLVDGRKCTDYVLAELLPSGRLVPKTGGTSGHFIVAEVEDIAPQALHILQRTLDMPQTTGLPLRLTISGKKRHVEGMALSMGGDSHMLATNSIKTVEVPASTFAYPKGFKVVPHETEVLYDSKTMNSNVEQFLNAFQ